jgi:ankyrin repeat protein
MCKSGLASLAFFYCDFRNERKKERRDLLSSLLMQLCDQSDSYYDILSSFYSIHGRGSQHPSDDELTRCLRNMINSPKQAPIYLIVDALDESPNSYGTPSPRENVLMLMEDLAGLRHPKLRICVTSRPEKDIEATLRPLVSHSVSLHGEEGQNKDIIDYITSVVNTDRRMQKWREEDRGIVIGTLSERADGMYIFNTIRLHDSCSYMGYRFRWVSCQFDVLRRCLPGCIRHALDELPKTLYATYERALQDIDDVNWEYAHRLFQCVTVASRPLRVEELATFLAFNFSSGSIPTYLDDWRLEDAAWAVTSTCSSLLSVNKLYDSSVVQFSHFSVKEFLMSSHLATAKDSISRHRILLLPAHTMVAQACLGALLHVDENVTDVSLKKFPLAEYAAEHWMDHTQFENVSLRVQDGMKRLFDPSKAHLAVWMWILDPNRRLRAGRYKVRLKRPSQPHGTPLHYAARYGMCDIAEFLVVECSQDVNSRRFRNHQTPLFIASEQGHAKVTRILLHYGADVKALDDNNTTPLHLVSNNGHREVVQILLNSDADANTLDYYCESPLHQASCGQHLEVVRLLLKHGADPNARDTYNQIPLHLALTDGDW